MPSSRAAEVSEALRARRADYLPRVFPAGKIRTGRFFIGNVQGDPGESLSIPLSRTAPGLRDFGGDFHGDDLDLFAAAMGMNLGDAIREAERQGYVSRQVRRAYTRREDKANGCREKARATENNPGNAEDQRHPTLGKPDILYRYSDAAGQPVFYVARWDRTNGSRSKEIRPLHWNGRAWDWKDPEGLLPLYNLVEVMAHDDKPVMIHEGENKVERAREELPQYAHAAWAHGSSSVTKADWPSLEGRRCIIWPDHDEAGREAALNVATSLLVTGAVSAAIVAVPGTFPVKWDLADDLPEGVTYDDIEQLAEQAVPFETPEIRPPEYSDDALALQLTERHEDELRYVAAWGKWYRWSGDHWEAEATLEVFDLARAVCREASAEANKLTVAKAITSTATVAAVERMARSDRCHAATVDQWDADPWLLNTPAGVVDLRTGDMRGHRREDYMTKVTAVGPGGECPQWLSFLDRVTAGDAALEAFLQRMVGYAFTGSVREHAFFFLYGTGANGKSVFLNTVTGIAAAYSVTAPMETFIASRVERHPTDLAGLRGARLVTSSEVEEGRRWAESKIKALTGGDTITARYMRQDFFQYVPQFKLVIAGNHKPGLRSVDEAIRRRLHLVPFTVTIPPDERDQELGENLRAEWPGILKWAIEGAADWFENGLQAPASVRDATEDYLASEDAMERWYAECCVLGVNNTATSTDLFQSWREWCEGAAEPAGSRKRFVQNLEARGLKIERWQHPQSRRHGFRGIRVGVDTGTDHV